RVSRWYIPERRVGRGVQGPTLGQRHDLAQLPSRHAVARPVFQAAATATVPGDESLVVCRLYVLVEGVNRGHVSEIGRGRGVNLPALGQHHYLAELPPGGEVVWPEGAVAVTR